MTKNFKRRPYKKTTLNKLNSTIIAPPIDKSTKIKVTLEKEERSSFFGNDSEEYTLRIKIKR
jgi:hypothetical protein